MTKKTLSSTSIPAAKRLRLASNHLRRLTELAVQVSAQQKQRESDRRYFVRVLLFPRLQSAAFQGRRPRQRKKEIQRLERIYFRLQG